MQTDNKMELLKIGVNKEYQKQGVGKKLLSYVAKNIGITEAKAYSVATFYENFSLEPKGKYVIKVCDGTACHIKEGAGVLAELEKELGVPAGTTTDDGLFFIQVVRCLGCCGLAPVMVINGTTYGKMTPDKVKGIINEWRAKEGK